MTNMVIRSTAGDGAWLDGQGGLARGIAGPSHPAYRNLGEPLLEHELIGPVTVVFPRAGCGSDGVFTNAGEIFSFWESAQLVEEGG